MKTLKVKKIFLLSAIALLATGCAGLQKPQSLLDAEKEYSNAANDPVVQKYSAKGLEKANKTLLKAASSECMNDMVSLAYIAEAEVKTAVSSAAAEQSMAISKDIVTQKESLIMASIKAKSETEQKQLQEKKNKAEIELQALQASEAEREILLAFGTIEFVSGTADLVPGASVGIDMLAKYMTKYPEKRVSVAGHTDSSGKSEFNQKLSQKRAYFIRDVLVSKGVSVGRISAIGYGQSQPIAVNTTVAGRQKNRRIDIKFN